VIQFAGFCVTVFQHRSTWFHVPGGQPFFQICLGLVAAKLFLRFI
jgi:hypothetical protein